MSKATSLEKRSEKGLLTPDNCVVAMVDLQPRMLFGVSSHDRQYDAVPALFFGTTRAIGGRIRGANAPIDPEARRQLGHLGATVVRPDPLRAGDAYRFVYKFDRRSRLERGTDPRIALASSRRSRH